MPFLLPAASSAACDITLLYLAYRAVGALTDSEEEYGRLIYCSGYMVVASILRLFLLLCPLPYHSYNGTALKCPTLYRLFYFFILVVLLVHMLALSMVDPTSLSSMLPTLASLTEHEELTRHIWLLLLLSLAADLCHILLFLHVRSTAPSDAELVPAGRPKVLFYYVKEKGETEHDMLLPNQCNDQTDRFSSEESISSTSMQQISSRVVGEIQSRLIHTKAEWTKRLADYRSRSVAPSTSNQDLIHRPLTAFRVLLQLFAYEDVLKNGRLDAVYDQDNGATLLNFVPQLLSFLLHGAYDSSTDLEDWILTTCRQNIYFAHRCYWFLRAWSLESQKTSNGVPARLSRASSLTSFEGADAKVQGGDEKTQKVNGNLLPEERAVIEELLHQVMICGEEPARRLYFGNGMESTEVDNITSDPAHSSPSALMFATQSGFIPIDPKTGNPSAKHWECVAATRKFGFLPLDDALTNHQRESKMSLYEKSYFDSTPVFLDALLTIAENLFKVPKEDRMAGFHRQLRLLEVQALPCNAIYIPLQDVNHRVWRIVADESISINTKERVPCIVCLEVVEYPADEAPQTRDVRNLLKRVAPQDAQITFPDITTSQSEKELITRWRYGYRDPHRWDTALEKIASQMRQGMKKIQLDQMRTSVKAQIDKVKNTNIQEFWTLSLPNTFDGDDEEDLISGPLHSFEPMPSKDIERGEPFEPLRTPSKGGLELPNAASMDSGSADNPWSPVRTTPMGQWTPPPKSFKQRATDLPPMDDLLIPPRLNHGSYQRMEKTETTTETEPKRRFSGCLPKPSSKVIEEKEETGASGKPPIKPPPVVFKENWKEKEERLRSKSAFGSLHGWRLLPILIKANDDLRQEQLASQIIYRISVILARERVPVWLCPYEILALTETGGIIEAIPDTISISSLKKNDSNYTSMKGFFTTFFEGSDILADAKANFCESLAGYSMVCFLLQIKDRHNGNILLDNKGHLIHIDFGFFFLSSPGKNTGFESAPFKLSREFVDVLDGPDSRLFRIFRMLCYRAFIALRRNCMEIILLIEMLKKGNEDLPCFRGRPDDAINELRHRFRLDLNDRACLEYVNALIDESLENWRTNWYDRYQRYCVGVL